MSSPPGFAPYSRKSSRQSSRRHPSASANSFDSINDSSPILPSVSRLGSVRIHNPLDDEPSTVLVELRCTFWCDGERKGRPFVPLAFAASLDLNSRDAFIRTLDDACVSRIKGATCHTLYAKDTFVKYEMERYLIWQGLEEARLPLSQLTDAELEAQWTLMENRGWRDSIRVQMQVETTVGDEGLKWRSDFKSS